MGSDEGDRLSAKDQLARMSPEEIWLHLSKDQEGLPTSMARAARSLYQFEMIDDDALQELKDYAAQQEGGADFLEEIDRADMATDED